MNHEQLMGRYFRLQQELSIAYSAQPWNSGRIDRLADELANTEREIAAEGSSYESRSASKYRVVPVGVGVRTDWLEPRSARDRITPRSGRPPQALRAGSVAIGHRARPPIGRLWPPVTVGADFSMSRVVTAPRRCVGGRMSSWHCVSRRAGTADSAVQFAAAQSQRVDDDAH